MQASLAGVLTPVRTNLFRQPQRKRLQVEHARHISHKARLVKLADKICNLRDIIAAPPAGWSAARRREYVDWAVAVVARLRGVSPKLEALFDAVVAQRERIG